MLALIRVGDGQIDQIEPRLVDQPLPCCTLIDLSSEMLDHSRALNPECEHVAGEMRSLSLGRLLDAVLIHDAIG